MTAPVSTCVQNPHPARADHSVHDSNLVIPQDDELLQARRGTPTTWATSSSMPNSATSSLR
jgi:hypothetical protein